MSKRRLLLADDSVTIQKVVNLTFADEGIEVIAVGNGDLAMEKIEESRPDVVLADVNMPGLTGYEICERLRAEPSTHDIPVILLVGSFEPFDEQESVRVGANGFLTKPFQSIRQLVTKVSELLEVSGQSDIETRSEQRPALLDPWADAANDEPATKDIDHLYTESFADTVEVAAPDTSAEIFAETVEVAATDATPESFADTGMDDEMIETVYIDPPSDSALPPPEAGTYSSPFEQRVSQEYETTSVDRQEASSVDFEQPSSAPMPADEFAFSDSDLLELPQTSGNSSRNYAGPGKAGEPIANISPELMDAIVRRVVQELSEKR